jgi:hypothetical protein
VKMAYPWNYCRDAQEKISETTLSPDKEIRIIRITQKVSDHPAQ